MQALLINSVIAVVFLTVVAVLSNKLFFIYVLISIAAFILYQQDKQTAMESARKIRRKNEYQNRIPENKLHAFSLLGGWPGALVARAAFRHKTKKVPFVQIFWLTVAINAAITYALLIHYADNPLTNFLKTKLKQRNIMSFAFSSRSGSQSLNMMDGFAGQSVVKTPSTKLPLSWVKICGR